MDKETERNMRRKLFASLEGDLKDLKEFYIKEYVELANKNAEACIGLTDDLINYKKEMIEKFEKMYKFLRLRVCEDEFSQSVCEQTGECLEHQKCIKIKFDEFEQQLEKLK